MAAWVDAVQAMRDEVARALPQAITAGARLVALHAKVNHPYTNRTGRLERHTEHQFTTGSMPGGYRAEVHGGMPYGSFVEEGTSRSRPYPYLWPAWVETRDTVAHIIEASVVGAMERAQR